MARPTKNGLDYFPLDVDFFSDEKIGAIFVEFGNIGPLVIIKLLCMIYRNGYYIEWNEMIQMQLLRDLREVSLEGLNQIVESMVKWKFFDPKMFSAAKILTSRGIQRRYFEATKRRNRDKSKMPYILPLTEVNVANMHTETPDNVYNNGAKPPIIANNMYTETPQSKVKKSKVNTPSVYPPSDSAVGTEYENFLEEYFHPNRTGAIEQLCMSMNITLEKFRALARDVVNEWILRKAPYKDFADAADHLMRQVRIKLRIENEQTETSRRLANRRGTPADGKKQKNWDASFTAAHLH